MEVREVEYRSEEYREALSLRHAVLREPLGLEWTAEEKAAEKADRHFVLIDQGMVLACLSVRMVGGEGAKIRQMAVRAEFQRRGLGRELVNEVVKILVPEGVEHIFLHARNRVVGFYETLGFHKVGEQFEEVGLPHWRMERQMDDPDG